MVSHGHVLIWIIRYYKGKFGKEVAYTTFAALVYNIWRAMNLAFWELKVPAVKLTVKNIHTDIRGRVQNLISKKVKDIEREWFSSL